MAWICYILAAILFTVEPTAGMVVFGIGMLYHWKYWLAGIAAFFVGAGWKKPL